MAIWNPPPWSNWSAETLKESILRDKERLKEVRNKLRSLEADEKNLANNLASKKVHLISRLGLNDYL